MYFNQKREKVHFFGWRLGSTPPDFVVMTLLSFRTIRAVGITL